MAIKELSNVQIKSGNDWYKLCPFPVGFIYLSQNSTSPATTFGGTWAALNEDRFLRPSNEWKTGGSKKIEIYQLPAHNHSIRLAADYPTSQRGDGSGQDMWLTWYIDAAEASWDYIQNTGGGEITGLNTEIATLGTELLNLYLLDGGER